MTPFLFGEAGRRLFGVLHEREAQTSARGGILLIAPFGHEAIRIHRFQRVLADRLSRLGHDVLRFDHYGSGDAGGDDRDVRLRGWTADILRAHQILASRTARPVVCWTASRLGAVAAIRAMGELQTLPFLALWDPVIDGSAYLGQLRRQHVDALKASFSTHDPAWDRELALADGFRDEAIGFAIDGELRNEILQVRPDDLYAPAGTHGGVVRSPSLSSLGDWARRQPGAWAERVLDKDFEWTSDDSLNTALVPNNALSSLMKLIDAPGG